LNVAVEGVREEDKVNKMDPDTSAGWPWVQTGQKKKFFFDNPISSGFKDALDNRIERGRKRMATETFWIASLKSERVKLQKIADVKTRVFMIGPIDHVVASKMYFGAFASHMQKNRDRCYSMIGIDAESQEWHEFVAGMETFSPDCFDADYANFDGCVHPELIQAFGNVVNAWYGDGVENKNVRDALLHDIAHSCVLALNVAYQDHQGNPSGNGITGPLNCFINACMIRIVWMEYRRQRGLSDSLELFEDMMRDRNYGDDLVVGVKRNLDPTFVPDEFADIMTSHGNVLTSPSKLEKGIKWSTPDAISFLKRTSRRDEAVPGRWIAAMTKDTINELTNWVTARDDELMFKTNLVTACFFAAHHGDEFYTEFGNRLQAAVNEKNIYFVVPGRVELLRRKYFGGKKIKAF